jgi:uncharacterized protein (TIGR02145 family)
MRIKKFTLFAVSAVLMLAIFTNCKNEPEKGRIVGTVTDICGNTYNYVRIGDQYWMAENLRCNKYDTKSERAGETLKHLTSDDYDYSGDGYAYKPYYVDGRYATTGTAKCLSKLTSDLRDKLGYLYNWAAATGLATESASKKHTSNFGGNRQGICPNNWHLPTYSEWETLKNHIGANAGKKLKSKYGWCENKGTDEYAFTALPAGRTRVTGGSDMIGSMAFFWTSTPRGEERPVAAYYSDMHYDYTDIAILCEEKYYAFSVRCVKD